MVCAPAVVKTVMRPLPLMYYCHSEAFGCQCSSRKPPGLTVTKAAAIFFAARKLRESTTRTSPPRVCFVGAIASILKVYWYGDSARRPPTAALSCDRDAGKSAGNMYRLLFGKFLRALAGSPKFFDNTDGGVRLTQSERRKVLSSENAPSSNTSRNSQPSGPNPWMEWGNPAGKYQRSPSPTSPINTVPSGLRQVTRAFPYSMKAHSSAVCQCSSRKLPAVSRILTPARSFEDGNTFCVTSFVQPPSSIRL